MGLRQTLFQIKIKFKRLKTNSKCDKDNSSLIIIQNACFQNSNRMLKYVNSDFQINFFKQVNWLSLYLMGNRSNFQEIESNGVYLELLNPKCHEKTIALYKSCKLVEKLSGLYRDV